VTDELREAAIAEGVKKRLGMKMISRNVAEDSD